MAIVGVSIEKSVSFRGSQQPFSNVYFYEGPEPNAANAALLAAAVKADEVSLHSVDVSFLRYRVWTADGTPVANHMIAQGNLSGTGDQPTSTTLDRERAVLIQWPAGTNIRGQPVYLRKWYHPCGNCAGVTFSASNQQNTSEISSGNRTAIATAANNQIAQAVGADAYQLRSASGREPTSSGVCHRFLEHHQLGDQWR